MEDRFFRNAMGKFATGVTVIAAEIDGKEFGMTANAFVSVSLDPKLILVSIDHRASMLEKLRKTGRFTVSFLASDQQYVSMRFAGQLKEETPYEFDRFDEMPVVKDALAAMSCTVHQEIEAGDHILFIGRVESLQLNEGDPLLFFQGQYRSLVAQEQPIER